MKKTSELWRKTAREMIKNLPQEEKEKKEKMLDLIVKAIKPFVPKGSDVISYHRYPTQPGSKIIAPTQEFLILVPKLEPDMNRSVFKAVQKVEQETTIGVKLSIQSHNNRLFGPYEFGPDTSIVQDMMINLDED